MKLKSMQCPNCGAALEELKNGKLKCSSCLSEFKEDQIQPANEHFSEKMNPNQQKEQQVPKRKSGIAVWMLFLMILLSVIFIPAGLDFFSEDAKTLQPEDPAGENFRERPASEAMIAFTEQVFLKPFSQITAEELASIRYLEISMADSGKLSYDNQWVFRYGLEPFEEEAESYPAEEIRMARTLTLEKDDFSSFTGLEYLDFSNAGRIAGDQDSEKSMATLENLRYFAGNDSESIRKFASGLKDKSKITGLGCRLYSESDIEKLLEFPSLTRLDVAFFYSSFDNARLRELKHLKVLTLNLQGSPDLSFLYDLPNLEELTLDNAQDISDFSYLNAMSELEVLAINHGASLKSIAFIENMPNLHSLSFSRSKVLTLAPLRDKSSLTKLALRDNLEIKDITVLSSLSGLTELTCTGAVPDAVWHSLSGLEHLKKADIDAGIYEMLADTESLTTLTLEGEMEVSSLNTRFSQLENLTLVNASSSSEQDFQHLPNVKVLTLRNSVFDPDRGASGIFKLPQLEELTISDTAVTLDPAYLEGSGHLKILKFSNAKLKVYRSNGAFDEGLAPFQDKLSEFTKLEELYAPSAKLDSLAFVSEMHNLKKLDVSDNEITDLSPLSDLKNLKLAGIADNPLGDSEAISEEIVYLP